MDERCLVKFYTLFYYEIPKKRELLQITLNHSSDIDFKDFIEIYKRRIA